MAETNISRSRQSLTCSFCDYLAVTKGDYLNHVKQKHRFHPQFKVTCSFPSCKFTSKSWASFKLYVSKKHKNDVIENELDDEDDLDGETHDGRSADERETANCTPNVSRNELSLDNDVLCCITNLCMK